MTAERPSPSSRRERMSWLYRAFHYAVIPFVLRFWTRQRVEGIEHIEGDGPLILISNHIDNWDTYAIGMRIRGRIVHYLARADGMESRWLGWYWRQFHALPANREGLTEAIRILRDGGIVAVFPEGVISPTLVRAIAGSALLALRSGAPVVPVAITGSNRIRWRSIFHPPLLTIRYGPPRVIRRQRGVDSQAVMDGLMCEIASMLPAPYRGVYAHADLANPQHHG